MKKIIALGMATILLLSGCTINIFNNGSNEQGETAPLNGEIHEKTEDIMLGDVQLTNVEEYVSNVVRPVYNGIESNPDLEMVTKGETNWYSMGDVAVKLQYPAGAKGTAYERDYYYHPENGELIFAFWFLGQEEYRFYFYKNSLVRYIGPDGVTVDNPVEGLGLQYASLALAEAYIE